MAVNQLFRTFGVITREQFHTFTAPLLKRYPQIQALSFQRLVMQADRARTKSRCGAVIRIS